MNNLIVVVEIAHSIEKDVKSILGSMNHRDRCLSRKNKK